MKRLFPLGALLLASLALSSANGAAHSSQCQATRAIFYTSNDWLHLAQGLAADASACAQYYISIPPPAANKTQVRPNAATVVDALGSNFHALAEVNYTAWQNWVNTTGNSWYQAGQTARQEMDAAGFNAAAGDTWIVNELSSGVRLDSGTARQDVVSLVQGLYAGDGSDPPEQGMVLVNGVSQSGISLPDYKAELESWLQDPTFWGAMSADVSDFLQESYGDVRDYAVAGADAPTRAGLLNNFLQALLTLATAPNAPATELAARSYLSAAYGPLANASWAWTSSYGWTSVDSSVMADFISAQTYAMREASDDPRVGFAWNPLNSEGLSPSDFNTDVAGILDRLAGSIHETDGGDPEQACEATGCSAVVPGGGEVNGWSSFVTWTPTEAQITSPPLDIGENTPSGPLTVELQTGGVATTLPIASSLTLSSSSQTGEFSTASTGPWTPTLSLTIPAGSESASFYTEDSKSGSPTLTTNLNGAVATQTETIAAPAAPPPPPPPPAATVSALSYAPVGEHMHVSLQVVDATGKPLLGVVRLSLLQNNALVASTVASTTSSGTVGLTAGPVLARGCYTVKVASVTVPGYAWNGVSPTQSDCVTTLPLQLESLVLRPQGNHMHVSLAVRDDAGNPVEATVGLTLKLGTSPVATASVASDIGGALAVTPAAALERGCYSLAVSSVNAAGYSWNGVTPSGSYCVKTLTLQVGDLALSPREGHMHVALRVSDLSGQPLAARVGLSLYVGSTLVTRTAAGSGADGLVGLTSGASLARGCYRVVVQSVNAAGYLWNGLSPSGRLCVRSLPAHVAAVSFTRRHGHLHVVVHVSSQGRPIVAHVSFAVIHAGAIFASTSGETTSAGTLALTARGKLTAGCYSVRVERLNAAGFSWDRLSPTTNYCAAAQVSKARGRSRT